MDSTPYVKLAKGYLILPSLVTEFDKVCTQFLEIPAINLKGLRKQAFLFSHVL